ncbi:MAG: hypothetical protein M0Z66_00590 [Thermaerobacter sp.]|nr:hypothetical protein [Thermaerobacter sp.]
MSRVHGVPGEVVAAIAAVLAQSLGVSPDRLRVRMVGAAPPDDERGAWQLLGTMEQMRGRSSRR